MLLLTVLWPAPMTQPFVVRRTLPGLAVVEAVRPVGLVVLASNLTASSIIRCRAEQRTVTSNLLIAGHPRNLVETVLVCGQPPREYPVIGLEMPQ